MITGGGAIGAGYAYRQRKRLDNLKELERIIIYMENDIRYRHSIISVAFRNVSSKCKKPFSDWLNILSDRLDFYEDFFEKDTYDFSEIWDMSLPFLESNSYLHKEDFNNLKELGQTLGYLDITSQEMGIKLFLENLHTKISDISTNLNDKIRVSIIAGIVSGIFVVVLLV